MKLNSSKDYDYYYKWSYEIPFGLLLSILVVGVGMCVLRFILYGIQKCFCSSKPKPRDCEAGTGRSRCGRPKSVLKYFNGAIKDVMIRISNFLLIEFEEDEEMYKLFNVRVRGIVMHYVFLVIMGNMAVCIISFWNVFGVDILIDECHLRYDCFPLNKADLSPIETLPLDLEKCEEYVSTGGSNITMICFQLAYRYSEGLGEAGGLLFIIQLVTNVLIYFIVRSVQIALWIYRDTCCSSIHDSRWYKKIFPLLISMSLSILITGSFVVLCVFIPQRVLYDREEFVSTLDIPNRRLETYIYYITLVVLSTTPLVFGFGIRFDIIISPARNENKDTSDDTSKFALEIEQTLNSDNTVLY